MATAARTPDATAIKWKDATWSYEELSQRAGAVQALLLEQGIGHGCRVGISLSRDPNMVAAMLGTIAAGATYVALDPKYPKQRLQFMVENAECALVFSDQLNLAHLGTNQSLIPENKVPLVGKNPSELAYIIYTSGSTGVPKGVMVRNSSILQLIDWAHQTWSPEDFACVGAGTSISFDVSVFELFAPLTCGGAILLMDNILEFIDHPLRESVTLVSTVPSAMRQILRVKPLPESVRNVCIAGEAFPRSLADALISPHWRVFNLYGPTEDTVFSTVYEIKAGSGAVPIGHPIPGTDVYIMGADGQPVSNGTQGELCLAGRGLAVGYLNRPKLNEERFLSKPEDSDSRMYRTGDIVYRDEDGLIHYCGRQDQQIKLRGFRIELGEVQSAIEKMPAVFEATVLSLPNANGEPRLLAWVCPENLSQKEVRDHLADYLPDYMIPAAIIPIAAIPRLPNGKLDRNALPQPQQKRANAIKPTTDTEQAVAKIFGAVLGIEGVGRNENFIELGGDSLCAMSIISRIQNELGVLITLEQFFAHTTVADLASMLDSGAKDALDLPVLTRAEQRHWLTPVQEQMWIIEQLQPNRLDYLTAMIVALDTDASIKVVSDCTLALIKRHVSLHSIVRSNQKIEPLPHQTPPLQILDTCDDPKKSVEIALRQSAQKAINISTELPVRVITCSNAKRQRVVGMIVHHVAIDGWSIDIFVNELTQLIASRIGAAPPLSPLNIDTRDYAAWLRNPKVAAHHQAQCLERVEVLKNAPWKLNWPKTTTMENGLYCMDLPKGLLGDIAKSAKALKTTSFVIQLSAFAEVLCQHLAIPEIIIGTAALTRRHPELEKLVACLTNLVPLKIRRAESLEKSCTQNHEEVYQALESAEVPFAKIVDTLKVERDPGRNPLVQVAFGIEAPTLPAVHGSIRGQGEEVYLGHTRLDLTVWVRSSGDDASVIWNWRGGCLDEETIKNLHKKWIKLLEKGVLDPQSNWIMKRQFKRGGQGKTSRRPISQKLFDSYAGKDGVTWVYRATSTGSSLTNFVKSQRASLLERYRETGALLLRDFQLGDSSELAEVVNTLFSSQVKYGERSSPRSDVSKGVYTSTDHPHDQPIVLHNEQSYTLNWPLRILFRCDLPAKEGGATPIADMRKVLAELKPETVQKFSERGVLYQRNYHQGIGVSWQVAFQTEDPEVVAKYCRDNKIEYEWISDNHLQTRQLRPALRLHPESKELLFFNHALFFHVTSLHPDITAGLKRALPPSHYPTQTYWGNGQEFEPEVLEELRTVIHKNTVRFDWRMGDVLILDNMQVAHGRDPFVGPRKIIVAMADPVQSLYGEQHIAPAHLETK